MQLNYKWKQQIQIKKGFFKNPNYLISEINGKKVFLGWCKDKNIPVAIKQLKVNKRDKQKYIDGQIEAFQAFNHTNIIKYYSHTQNKQLIIQYCSRSNLKQYLKYQQLTSFQIWKIIYSINNVLIYLKSKKFFHRDLKPENVLFSQDGTIKICDFGRSKKQQAQVASKVGTPIYCAPEIFLQQSSGIEEIQYDYSCEIWSLGAILYELLTNQVLFKHQNVYKVNNKNEIVLKDEWQKQKQNNFERIENNIESKTWLRYIKKMLNFNSQERKTCQVLKIELQQIKKKTINKPKEIQKYLYYRYQRSNIWKKIYQESKQKSNKLFCNFGQLCQLSLNCFYLQLKNIKELIDNQNVYIGDYEEKIKVVKSYPLLSQCIELLSKQREQFKDIGLNAVQLYRMEVKKIIIPSKSKIKLKLYHMILIACQLESWFPLNPKILYNHIKTTINVPDSIMKFNIFEMENRICSKKH